MIIDINSRRSGKTTRLVENVVRRLTFGEKSVIISHSFCMANMILKRVRELNQICNQCGGSSTVSGSVISAGYNSVSLRGYDPYVWMHHYDEFDFYLSEIDSNLLYSNGYYCSSPSSYTVSSESCLIKLVDRVVLKKEIKYG